MSAATSSNYFFPFTPRGEEELVAYKTPALQTFRSARSCTWRTPSTWCWRTRKSIGAACAATSWRSSRRRWSRNSLRWWVGSDSEWFWITRRLNESLFLDDELTSNALTNFSAGNSWTGFKLWYMDRTEFANLKPAQQFVNRNSLQIS